MPLVNGKCPLCGNEIRIPEGQEKAFCPSCGEEILTEAAVLFYDSMKNGAPSNSMEDLVYQSNTASVSASAIANGSTTQQINRAIPRTTTETESGSPSPTNNLLNNWSTSYGATIAGIVTPIALLTFLSVALGSLGAGGTTFSIVIYLAFVVMGIIYALVFYKSYFSDKPRLTSNGAVSFWNGFFGSFIFGCLWNSNLTNKKRGVSNYVYAVGQILVVIFIVLAMASLTSILSTYASQTGSTTQQGYGNANYSAGEASVTVPGSLQGTWNVVGMVIETEDGKTAQFEATGNAVVSSESMQIHADPGIDDVSPMDVLGTVVLADNRQAFFQTDNTRYPAALFTTGEVSTIMLSDSMDPDEIRTRIYFVIEPGNS